MRLTHIAIAALLCRSLVGDAPADSMKDTKTTDSGIEITTLQEGTGKSPTAKSTVKVKYRGTFLDGKEFDKSDRPIEFPLNGVIKCWTEGLQHMKEGGKAKLVCPSNLAYGKRGTPGIPPDSDLVFEVELLEVK